MFFASIPFDLNNCSLIPCATIVWKSEIPFCLDPLSVRFLPFLCENKFHSLALLIGPLFLLERFGQLCWQGNGPKFDTHSFGSDSLSESTPS